MRDSGVRDETPREPFYMLMSYPFLLQGRTITLSGLHLCTVKMKLSHVLRASMLGIALAQDDNSLTDVLASNNSTLSALSGTSPLPNPFLVSQLNSQTQAS